MSRPLRIELAGGLYHVTSRGDRREAIYRDDQDRTAWLTLLGEVCRRFNWGCHAYCQMTNHYHIAAEANHTVDKELQDELDALYLRLVAEMESYDDGSWQE